MQITLHTILGFKDIIGQRQTELELPAAATVQDLLNYVRARWGDQLAARLFEPNSNAVLPYIQILINSRAIHFLQGVETPLHEGAQVLILPPVSGG